MGSDYVDALLGKLVLEVNWVWLASPVIGTIYKLLQNYDHSAIIQ